MINKIGEILTTFTEEAQKVVIDKSKEHGFDPNRGIISLDESFLNLNAARELLQDAIEKEKLVQLPITIQKDILQTLEAISKSLVDSTSGKDIVVNLTTAIEKLNVYIWQYGFHNLSEEVLGYQTKLNQLKNQELEIKKIKEELENGLRIKADLEQILADAQNANKTVQEIKVNAEASSDAVEKTMNSIVKIQKDAMDIFSSVQEIETKATTSSDKIKTTKEKIDLWAEEIETLSVRSEEIKKNLEEREATLTGLINKTEETHKRVEDLLPGATSAGLASAFRTRKDAIIKTKKYWMSGFVLSLLGLLGMVIWMVHDLSKQSEGFEWWKILLQRAPLTFPLIWLGWFFGRNYGHVIRLEEDYAHKETVSSSFEGYKKQMSEVDSKDALPRLCNTALSILSENPLRVFDRKTSDETPAHSLLDKLSLNKKKDSQEE